MMVPGRRRSMTRCRVHILSAELLATGKTPGLSTACAHNESPTGIQSTRKDIVTGRVFQAPTLTPGTLLGVLSHSVEASDSHVPQ
jgi:hypothetical protein